MNVFAYIRGSLIGLSRSLKAVDIFFIIVIPHIRIGFWPLFDGQSLTELNPLMSGCFDGDLWCKLRMYQLVVFACSCVFMFTLSTNLQCHSWCPHTTFSSFYLTSCICYVLCIFIYQGIETLRQNSVANGLMLLDKLKWLWWINWNGIKV